MLDKIKRHSSSQSVARTLTAGCRKPARCHKMMSSTEREKSLCYKEKESQRGSTGSRWRPEREKRGADFKTCGRSRRRCTQTVLRFVGSNENNFNQPQVTFKWSRCSSLSPNQCVCGRCVFFFKDGKIKELNSGQSGQSCSQTASHWAALHKAVQTTVW